MVRGIIGIFFVKYHYLKRNNSLPTLAVWCAKLYEDNNYGGWVKVVAANGFHKIDSSLNDQVSSIQVYSGCSLKAYEDYDGNLMQTFTGDVNDLRNPPYVCNDELSAYECNCGDIFNNGK